MTIKDEFVYVPVNAKHYKYYENLGYEIPRKENGLLDIGKTIKVNIEHLPLRSDLYVTKICDYCGEESLVMYGTTMKARKFTNKDCCNSPTCVGQKIMEVNNNKSIPKGKSLLEKFPEIASEYSIELNKKHPSKVSYGSDKTVWWICKKNKDHIWDDSVKHRTSGKRGCHYCSNFRINHTNCLATTHPELIREWNAEFNTHISIYEISYGSSEIAWWNCPDCLSVYDLSVAMRASCGQNCPYCRGMRVNYTNCLATKFPKIAEEWDYKHNDGLTPNDVTYGNDIKVWWKCSTCNHNWYASVGSRTNMKSGCPSCNQTTVEKEIYTYLNGNNIKFEIQYTFPDLQINNTKLRYDFAIFDKSKELKYILEYDGEYHYIPIRGNAYLEKVQYYDKVKDEYCRRNGIDLIRIPYFQHKEMKSIINKYNKKYKLI